MTAKNRPKLQRKFLDACRDSPGTLDAILKEQHISPESLAEWLTDAAFRGQLHAMQEDLCGRRELQLQLGAARAASELTSTAGGTDDKESAVRRAACVDLIRLARDSKARQRAANPTADEHAALYHPRIDPDEALELMEQLARARGENAPADPTAAAER